MKADEVEGDSEEVGAKVMYQGRQMIVSTGMDGDGDLKMCDYSGIIKLCEALPQSSLTSLECAALSLIST